MHRLTRLAPAAAAAILSLGLASPAIGSPALAAGPHGVSASVTDRPGQHSNAAVKNQKSVLKSIARLDKQLVRISTSSRITDLAPEDKAAVLANVTADRAALDAFVDRVKDAKTNAALKKIRRALKAFRVQNYHAVVDLLEYAPYLLQYIEDARLDLAELVDDGSIADPTTLSAMLDAAQAKVTSAVAAARALTSRSTKADLRAVDGALTTAEADIEAVDEAIWNA